jgi:hypothetical protein
MADLCAEQAEIRTAERLAEGAWAEQGWHQVADEYHQQHGHQIFAATSTPSARPIADMVEAEHSGGIPVEVVVQAVGTAELARGGTGPVAQRRRPFDRLVPIDCVDLERVIAVRGAVMSRPMILVGCWPRRLCAELAATYCGEPSTNAFLKRVGKGLSSTARARRTTAAMASRRPRPGDSSPRIGVAARSRRGFVTMTLRLPRHVIPKSLADGTTGFYFNIPTRYRKAGCTIPNEPLGNEYAAACGVDGRGGGAAALNGLFDEWLKAKNGEPIENRITRHGTVDWLFREYKNSKRYRERVSSRTRQDYELLMQIVLDLPTKRGDRVAQRLVKSITPLDKIYEQVCIGPHGPRPRQGEKVVALCRAAWRVVHRLHPDCFNRDVPNPWEGVTKQRRTMKTKPAVTREQVYKFAWGAISAGYPEPAAAAVICFEFLQRPENVLAGYLARLMHADAWI